MRSREDEPIDYHGYRMSLRDMLACMLIALLLSGTVAYIFYKSLLAFLILFPIACVAVPPVVRDELRRRRDERLRAEFRDTIVSISGYLSAGYSMENAFAEALKEMQRMGPKDSLMLRELASIVRGIRINQNVEQLLLSFAARSGNDDIQSFAQVFSLSKRNGGDMREVIERTANVIRDKVQVKEDIKTATQAVRFEQLVMSFIPFFVVFYIDLSSAEFLEPLYEGIPGRAVMTVALIMMAVSFLLSRKLTDIGF